jgi:hypothetical protein
MQSRPRVRDAAQARQGTSQRLQVASGAAYRPNLDRTVENLQDCRGAIDLARYLRDLASQRSAIGFAHRLGAFERHAVSIMQGRIFGMIQLSSFFHVYGKMNRRPGRDLLDLMERQATDGIAFNTQAIANTL